MKKLLKFLLLIFFFFASAFLWFFLRIYSTAQIDNAEPADAIVVLGAAAYEGKPSPVLQARLDHAYELFNKKMSPLIITTGGTYSGEKLSEGATGKQYLIILGVPVSKIIAEENSSTTRQNIMRAAEIAKAQSLKKIILVSDPFHMYRAIRIAKDFDIDVFSSPTLSSPISKNKWLEFQYMLREDILTFADIFF